MDRLHKTTLDVVLLHAPYCWRDHCTKAEERIPWQTGWKNLIRLQHELSIKKIGVSNFDEGQIRELLELRPRESIDIQHPSQWKSPISVIQNWMDPFHQDHAVRAISKKNALEYMAYSSFGTQWHGKFKDSNPVLNNHQLRLIAEKYESNVPTVILVWLMYHENVIAIPRSSSPEHIQQNFAHFLMERHRVDDTSDIIREAVVDTDAHHWASLPNPVFNLDDNDIKIIRSLDGTLGAPWED